MNVITCVYCGSEYPAGTPASGADVKRLTGHISVCERHPLRAAETRIGKLEAALGALIGVTTRQELDEMRKGVALIAATDPETAALSIQAIDALLESTTLP